MRINFSGATGTLFWYGATVFLTSAFLLVLEIAAGRLLAPYVGVSLYTWTSIIGVILAGLSLGNWLGGHMADRGAGETSVGMILLGGAVMCFAILMTLMLVARTIQGSGLSLLSASFVYVFALFFLPAILLGVTTPLLTTLALKRDTRTGHVVGRMHALAAFGSIAGTFVTGYWLVQTIGTKNIILGTSLALACLALPYLRHLRRKAAVVAGGLIVSGGLAAVTHQVQGFVNPCDVESSYYCLRVVDELGPGGKVTARSLVLDHMTHSTNDKHQPDRLWMSYAHAMHELTLSHFEEPTGLRYFFAGGGAYTYPRALRFGDPTARVTVSELDPTVTDVAQKDLYLDSTGMRILHGDARVALQSLGRERFDVVVTDVYHDVAIPYHLATLEYHRLVKSSLSAHGLHLMNVIDAFPDPRLVKAIQKTLETQFRYVDVWLERPPQYPSRLTYVISASDHRRVPDILRSQTGEPRAWYAVTDVMRNTGTPMSDVPVLTDDYAPIESLITTLLADKAGL